MHYVLSIYRQVHSAQCMVRTYFAFIPKGPIIFSNPFEGLLGQCQRSCGILQKVVEMKFVTQVSCLFTKHILSSGFVNIDHTEILCTPKRCSSIALHFTSSTFFCQSAVCLLISQNVNKKPIGISRWTFLGPKPLIINF